MKWLGRGVVVLSILVLGLWALRPPLPDAPSILLTSDARIDTIVVFGTSLSHAPRYSWPDDLAAALEPCHGTPPRITRVTRPGANSTWALSALDTVTQAKPDVVIIEFAINDADIADGLSLTLSHKNHAALLDTLRADLPNAQILLMTTNPISGLNQLKRYRLGAYFRLYTDLSQQYGTGLIHMAPYWHGKSIPDGVHPQNGDASAVMVPHLFETLTNGRCALPG